MRLKSLTLQGFKSFYHRTVLNFPHDITAVVGPNGCGKSNVVDAIKWALGEQSAKVLRGKGMDDVIFAGSEKLGPLGMAEVTLIFSRDEDEPPPVPWLDFPEIKIGRIIHRDGSSEYRLQNLPCRLKDISEVFSGTGLGARTYSIIEQGKISSLIASKPDERRALFEEAARITRYRNRRKEARRRLAESKKNLQRIEDLINELDRQVKTLKRQKKQAENYEKLIEEISHLEKWKFIHDFNILSDKIISYEKRIAEETKTFEGAKNLLEIEKTKIETVQVEKYKIEQKYKEGLRLYIDMERNLNSVETEIKLLENNILHNHELLKSHKSELEDLKKRISLKGKMVGQSTEKATHFKAVIHLKEEEIKTVEQKFITSKNDKIFVEEKLNDINRQLIELEKEKSGIIALNESQQKRYDSITLNIKNLSAKIEPLKIEIKELTDSRSQLHNHSKTIIEERNLIEHNIKEFNSSIQSTNQNIKEISNNRMVVREKISKLSGEFKYLQEVIEKHEELGDGDKKLIKIINDNNLKSQGILVDLIKPKKEWNRAVNALVASYMGYNVISDKETAQKITTLATDQEIASGLILDTEKSEYTIDSTIKIIPVIKGLEESASPLLSLFDGWYLADNFNEAMKYISKIPPHGGIVTKKGVIVSKSGIIAFNGKNKNNIFDLRSRYSEVKSKLSNSKAQDEELRQKEISLQESLETLNRKNSDLKNSEKSVVKKLEESVKEIDRLKNKIELSKNNLEFSTVKLNELNDELKSLKITDNKTELNKIIKRIEILREEASKVKTSLKLHIEKTVGYQEELSDLKISLQSWKNKYENEKNIILRLETEINENNLKEISHSKNIENIKENLASYNDSIKDKQQKATQFASILLTHKKSQDELTSKLNEINKVLKDHNISLGQKESKLSQLSEILSGLKLEKSKFDGNITFLIKDFREKYGSDIKDSVPLFASLGEFTEKDQIKKDRLKLKSSRSKMEYNPNAIKEYDEVSARYSYFCTQRDDLLLAIKSLEDAISIITKTTRAKFMEAFDNISTKFSQLFPQLFNGGSAKLILGEGDPLEAGVEIIAQPPGKRLQSMELLSGGEKAMTAIALIFSMFLFSPSPFCILDEVDAPLDESNVEKYNDLLQSMGERTQFIVVTHNRLTMEASQQLYGVTMEEPGVSRVVSLKISEIDTFNDTTNLLEA